MSHAGLKPKARMANESGVSVRQEDDHGGNHRLWHGY